MLTLRPLIRWTLVGVLLALAIAGCLGPSPGLVGTIPTEQLRQQAHAALDRWAAAVGAAKKQGIVVVGELTSQIGDWEEPVGENNKVALMSGAVRPTASMSTTHPPPGDVRWPDGTSATVELLSADQALDEIIKSGDTPCSDCRPLDITAARLTSGSVQTSRGPATVPIWEFTVEGTNVKVTRVAIADRISVVPPPWDPNNSPEGIRIESARGKADALRLTVTFVGAPAAGDQRCGADYTAEDVESELAVVVIVIEHPNPTPGGACRAVGAERTATVDLATPLGDRAVLEVTQGLPVPVSEP